MDIKKIDDNQIEVTKTDTVVSKNTFSYEYLISQRVAIQKQADDFAKARQAELDEINFLLAECNKLNVTAKPIEVPPLEVIK